MSCDGDWLQGWRLLVGFQVAQLFVQVCKSLPQQLLVARISAGFQLLKHSFSRERQTLFSRQSAAPSALSLTRGLVDFSSASACCASTDLLSHPRAISTIIVNARGAKLLRRECNVKNRDQLFTFWL